jgi:hypothetical protein
MQMSCQSNAKVSGSSMNNVVAPDFSRIPAVMPIVDGGAYPHNPNASLQLALAEEAATQQTRQLQQVIEQEMMRRNMRGQGMGGSDARGLSALAQFPNMNGGAANNNSALFGSRMPPFQMPYQS